MKYDVEAEARRLNGCPRLAGCPADRVSGCDALCRDARQRAEDALRAAYAAGERAGAERMRERAAKAARQSAFPWSAEDRIRALPLDGGDHG